MRGSHLAWVLALVVFRPAAATPGAGAPCTVAVGAEPETGSTSVSVWTLGNVLSWEVPNADSQVRQAVQVFDLDGQAVEVVWDKRSIRGVPDGWYRITLPSRFATPVALESGKTAQVERFGLYAEADNLLLEPSGWLESQVHFGPAAPELVVFRQCPNGGGVTDTSVVLRFSEAIAWSAPLSEAIILRNSQDDAISCAAEQSPTAVEVAFTCPAGEMVESIELRGGVAADDGSSIVFPAPGERLPMALGELACHGWWSRPYDRAFEARHGAAPEPMPTLEVPACGLEARRQGCTTVAFGPGELALLLVLGVLGRSARRKPL